MQFSRPVLHALQVVLRLAEVNPSIPYPSDKLARDANVPRANLRHTLYRLVAYGILGSNAGFDGGYWLARKLDDVSLLDIVEAVNGPIVAVIPHGRGLSKATLNPLRRSFAEVAEVVRTQLNSIKISTFAVAGDSDCCSSNGRSVGRTPDGQRTVAERNSPRFGA